VGRSSVDNFGLPGLSDYQFSGGLQALTNCSCSWSPCRNCCAECVCYKEAFPAVYKARNCQVINRWGICRHCLL